MIKIQNLVLPKHLYQSVGEILNKSFQEASNVLKINVDRFCFINSGDLSIFFKEYLVSLAVLIVTPS